MSTDFWDSRPVLTHVQNYARARLVSPWAVLGVTLARAAASTPPNVQLPPVTGGPGSLNLFVALVGRPGQGKGAAEAAARNAVRFVSQDGRPPQLVEQAIGSGEGLARTFRPHGTDEDEPNPEKAALFSVPEVDTLAALGTRQGSTLLSQVRSLYSGERLGFANAGKDTRITVESHSYRAALVVGVQPAKAGYLLDDADGGTPQRFVWLPTTDPGAPDDTPDCPDPWTVTAPEWGLVDRAMPVPAEVVQELRDHRRDVLRGAPDVDPLDGHAMQTRLKVAAALTILDGRPDVTGEDWTLAGTVMGMSAATRGQCLNAASERARRANVARAHAAEERAVVQDRLRHERAVGFVRKKLTRSGGSCTRRDLSQGTKSELRPHLDDALDELVDAGEIVAETIDGGTRFTVPSRSNGPTVQHAKPQVEALDENALDRRWTP